MITPIRLVGAAALSWVSYRIWDALQHYSAQPEVQARLRAKRNAWQIVELVLWIPLLLGSLFGIVLLFIQFHKVAYPDEVHRNPNAVGLIVVVFAALFMAIPISMLVANFLMWLIPPARIAMQKESKDVPDIDFASSNTQLLLGPTSPEMDQSTPKWGRGPLGCLIIVGGTVVAFIGASVPWGK